MSTFIKRYAYCLELDGKKYYGNTKTAVLLHLLDLVPDDFHVYINKIKITKFSADDVLVPY